jgi:hypothetical protein
MICFYKVSFLNINPVSTSILFKKISHILGEYQLCSINVTPDIATIRELIDRYPGRTSFLEGYFVEPILYREQDWINISVKPETQENKDEILLGGFVLERSEKIQ